MTIGILKAEGMKVDGRKKDEGKKSCKEKNDGRIEEGNKAK